MGRATRLRLGVPSAAQTGSAANVVYAKPVGAPDAGWTMTVDGADNWVHYTSRGPTTAFSTDAAADIDLAITAPSARTTVEVFAVQDDVWPPLDLPMTFAGAAINITVPAGFTGNVFVKTAEAPNWQDMLSIGVLPLETDAPAQPSDVTYYFGPGMHTGATITLNSNDTVYVAGGAYVNRRFVCGTIGGGYDQKTNIKIFGRGVIDTNNGYGITQQGLGTMDLAGITGLTITGITYASRYGYAIATYQCKNVVVDRIRLYSCEVVGASTYTAEGTPDGIDPIACQGFTFKRSFASASDDTSAIKASKYGANGNVSEHLYESNLYCQGGKSNASDIGYELGTYTTSAELQLLVTGVTYRRILCPIVWRDQQSFRTNGFGIHCCTAATVTFVLYEDIWMPNIKVKDWDIFVSTFYTSGFSSSLAGDANRGVITDVTYRRVKWPTSGNRPVRIAADLSDPVTYVGKKLARIKFEQCERAGVALTAPQGDWTVSNADVTFS